MYGRILHLFLLSPLQIWSQVAPPVRPRCNNFPTLESKCSSCHNGPRPRNFSMPVYSRDWWERKILEEYGDEECKLLNVPPCNGGEDLESPGWDGARSRCHWRREWLADSAVCRNTAVKLQFCSCNCKECSQNLANISTAHLENAKCGGKRA